MNPREVVRRCFAERWNGAEMAAWNDEGIAVPASNVNIHIGQRDRYTDAPEIAVFKAHETPGGGTGAYGVDGETGEAVQLYRQTIYVDCVGGTHADVQGVGVNGETYDPEQLAYALYEYSADLIRTYKPFSGYEQRWQLPGESDGNFTDTDPDVEPSFREQYRIRRRHTRRPKQPYQP